MKKALPKPTKVKLVLGKETIASIRVRTGVKTGWNTYVRRCFWPPHTC